MLCLCFFFSSRRRHTRLVSDWSSDVCSSDLIPGGNRSGKRWNRGVCSTGWDEAAIDLYEEQVTPVDAVVGASQSGGRLDDWPAVCGGPLDGAHPESYDDARNILSPSQIDWALPGGRGTVFARLLEAAR